jgi:3-hydroxyacyl-CoA dehydrogenase/enoyl-CoA hydratase/3-hydroxybutyryl-CoA epimerase
MYDYQHLALHKDIQGIVWMKLDVRDKGANILTPEVLEEIQIACGEIKHMAAIGVIICSAKPNGFIAGADIERFKDDKAGGSNIERARAYIDQGQKTCDVVEDIQLPTVAMIDGFCMGGGTELSLACDYIIASDSPKTKISLPEIKLGIHPGFGGTVRSIRRMGILKAMPMMLTGRNISGRSAAKMGLADYCVPLRQLKSTAVYAVLNKPEKKAVPKSVQLLNKKPIRSLVARKMRSQVAEKANPDHYPAPFALIDLWEQHGGNEAEMYEHEAQSVSKLILTETAQNLVRVFFLQTQLKGLGKKSLIQPKHVHVIGGGVMGGDIATWCAAQGLNVTVQDTSEEALGKVIQRANKNLQKKLKKHTKSIRDSLDRQTPD